VFSSTLEIKKILNVTSLPPQSDFILPGRNTLLYSVDSYFKDDFIELENKFGISAKEVKLNVVDKTTGKVDGKTTWARDFITCKTSQEAYVINNDVFWIKNHPDKSIIKYNSNIAPSILWNSEHFVKLNDKFFKYKPTNIISAGGNIFHCVNAVGKSFAIAGEMAITSEINIIHTPEFLNSLIDNNTKTGSRSSFKYYFPSNFSISDSNFLVGQRALNKKILKSQLDKETDLVIIPNSIMWHIDVEMAFLPNGVVLLHSFDKTLQLLDECKDQFAEYDDIYYDDIYKVTQKFAEQSRDFFKNTKRKLEKRDFIVKEICGFVSDCNEIMKGIIACGLNSLVGVTKEGAIFYTLCSDNPSWYQKYIEKELQECGVSQFYYLSNPNSLEILRENEGSIRCQHNTIANQSLLFNSKKRFLENPDQPPTKKQNTKSDLTVSDLSKVTVNQSY